MTLRWVADKKAVPKTSGQTMVVLSHGVLSTTLMRLATRGPDRSNTPNGAAPDRQTHKYPFGFRITAKAGVRHNFEQSVYAKSDQEMKLWMSHIGFCCGMGHGESRCGRALKFSDGGGVAVSRTNTRRGCTFKRHATFSLIVRVNSPVERFATQHAAVAAAAAIAAGDGAADGEILRLTGAWRRRSA